MPQKKRQVVRTTVPMDEEVLQVFRRMAATMGCSVGRAIGDWCADTIDSAQFVLSRMEQAKQAPAVVMREMQAMANTLQQEVSKTAREVRERGRGGPDGRRGRA